MTAPARPRGVAVIGAGVVGRMRARTVAGNPATRLIAVADTEDGRAQRAVRGTTAAGKHVLCEKPLGIDIASCRTMIDAAAAAGRVLAVGFNHRYYPPYRIDRSRSRAGWPRRPRRISCGVDVPVRDVGRRRHDGRWHPYD